MKSTDKKPAYIFATSWEVCNKVGGIYTVLSTQARMLQHDCKDRIFYIGPDLWKGKENPDFAEDAQLLKEWNEQAAAEGISVRTGRWNVPGSPIVFLVDYSALFEKKNDVYGAMWNDYRVDSLKAYGDYDEACMFSLAAGKLAECIYRHFLQDDKGGVVYQAHEWMSGCGMLYIKKHCPEIGCVFTTHATSIGRSITTNDKPLYDYFKGYNGDQMAGELHMEAKHSIEKQAALHADCLTTVSHATDLECKQFFGKASDVILPNGFEEKFVPKGRLYTSRRKVARDTIINVANCLMGTQMEAEKTFIFSTSGRNDFRCKGFDVLIDAFARMQRYGLQQEALAVIAVPCWKKEARHDLLDRLNGNDRSRTPLPDAFITHELYNMGDDRIVNTLRAYGIRTDKDCRFHVMFVPSYLDGNDGILNLNYYDWLIGCDYCLYPSYYEPWGYTCLESIAFGIPCLTTCLSGFGQWANETVGHTSRLEDGVAVIDRTDSSYEDTARAIACSMDNFMKLTPAQRKAAGEKAKALAAKASWKHFIKHYYEAYETALRNASQNRTHYKTI